MAVPRATTLVFLGRSGSGKDTQMEFLLASRDFSDAVKISTGDLFRQLSKKDSLVGLKVKKILDEGGLPPLWLASSLWLDAIDDGVTSDNIMILDGTPRRLEEAKLLDEVMGFLGRPLAVAVYIDVGAEESSKRLLSRGRSDDTESRIKNRLSWFETEVLAVIDYYKTSLRLLEVNGEQTPEKVFEELRLKLNEYFKK